MIRNYANHQEAAVRENRTGIESEPLHGTMEDGGSGVGSMHAMTMVVEEGGDRGFMSGLHYDL